MDEPTNDQPAFTLRAAAGLPDSGPPLDQSIVVVIDAQDEYGPTGMLALPNLEPALTNLAIVLAEARKRGTPIVHVAHEGPEGRPFDPEAGGRIMDAAAPANDEPVVSKTLPNAFAGTALSAMIEERGHNHLVLVGFMTHMCVGSTARAALDLGYETTVISDATATRALPDPDGGPDVAAPIVHRATLAALADRFAIVATTAEVLA